MRMITVIMMNIGFQPFRTRKDLKGHLDQHFPNFCVHHNDMVTNTDLPSEASVRLQAAVWLQQIRIPCHISIPLIQKLGFVVSIVVTHI